MRCTCAPRTNPRNMRTKDKDPKPQEHHASTFGLVSITLSLSHQQIGAPKDTTAMMIRNISTFGSRQRSLRGLTSIGIGSGLGARAPDIISSNYVVIVIDTKFFSTTKKDGKYLKSTGHSSAGLPEYLEHWNRGLFHKVGYGLAAVSALSVPSGEILLSAILSSTTAAYWYLGLQDINSLQSIRRNFPVLGRTRYLLESIRPEIRQYFIEGDEDALPFSRLHRAVVYKRARNVTSTMPFGTKRDTQ